MMSDDKSKEIPTSGEEAEPKADPVEVSTESESDDDSNAMTEEQMTEALLERIAELEDKWQRSLADAENVRRRSERQQAEAIAYANTAFARELLSISDNLDRALAAGTEDPSVEDLAQIVEGVEMTRRELRSVFEKHGVKRIEPQGEKFDHNFHQAVAEVEDSEAAPGTIVDLIQPGYILKDRLLRPAMVTVAKARKEGKAVEKSGG